MKVKEFNSFELDAMNSRDADNILKWMKVRQKRNNFLWGKINEAQEKMSSALVDFDAEVFQMYSRWQKQNWELFQELEAIHKDIKNSTSTPKA